MKIHLHIERLVVEGLSLNGRERELLVSALESRLTELLLDAPESNGLLAGGHMSYLAAPSIPISGHPEPRTLGLRIGDAVDATLRGNSAGGGRSHDK